MPPLRFGTPSASVAMDDDFSILIRQTIEIMFPGVYNEMERAIDRIYRNAVAKAPVKTGDFKRSIKADVLVAPDYSYVRGRVYSDIEYGRYILAPRKLPGTGSAFVELFRKPMAEEADRLTSRLAVVIDDSLGG